MFFPLTSLSDYRHFHYAKSTRSFSLLCLSSILFILLLSTLVACDSSPSRTVLDEQDEDDVPQQHEPFIFEPPMKHQQNKLKYGQCSCMNKKGDLLVIGANGYESFKGTIYVYNLTVVKEMKGKRNRKNIEIKKTYRITPSDANSAEEKTKELRPHHRGSGFGFSCSISNDENVIVIGAPGQDFQRGVVYIYKLNRSQTKWKQVNKLHPNDENHRKNGDTFGWDVSVDNQCKTIAISVRGNRSNNGQVIVYTCEYGCVNCKELDGSKLYPHTFVNSLSLDETKKNLRIRNNFGMSLSISGNGQILSIGCTGYEDEMGIVYVYEKINHDNDDDDNDDDGNASGKWNMTQILKSPNKQPSGFFGFKVDINDNGQYIAVGADGEENYRGSAYIFKRSDGQYKSIKQLQRNAENRQAEDNFGGSLSISDDGNVIVIGAPGATHNHFSFNDHGVAFIYERNGNESWVLKKSIWLPPSHSTQDMLFAWDVSVNGDGTVVVGTAPDWNSEQGLAAMDIFERDWDTDEDKPWAASCEKEDRRRWYHRFIGGGSGVKKSRQCMTTGQKDEV